MSRFIETIRFEEGNPLNLEYHQQRVNRTCAEQAGCTAGPDLAAFFRTGAMPCEGICKCRIVYRTEIEVCTFSLYTPKQIRDVQLVHADSIEYTYKYENRAELERLLSLTTADEILIVKNGYVSDASFANVVFSDGDALFTPAHPLLRGTQRQKLLDAGCIREAAITPADFASFETFQLINAMLPLEAGTALPVSAIRF
jgi:4-amino-4-deoxychorismate lyase